MSLAKKEYMNDLKDIKNSKCAKEFTFCSQLGYGKFGSKICTLVSFSSCSLFLRHCTPIEALLTPEQVHEIMSACHSFYESNFSAFNCNLMFIDICSYLEPCLHYIEIAGVVTLDSECKCNNIQVIDDQKLLIINFSTLSVLLKDRLREHEILRFCIVVTFNSHTISFLYDKTTGVWFFDSLQASLRLVSSNFDLVDFLEYNFGANIEYSGVILFHQCNEYWFNFLLNKT